MKRLIPIYALAVAAALGCESSPPAKQTRTDAVPKSEPKESAPQLETEELVQRAQLLRDREFPTPPGFEAVEDFEAPHWPGCKAACEAERAMLTDVFFAGTTVRTPERFAYWNGEQKKVIYDATADADVLRADVLAALVEGLDDVTGAQIVSAQDWDGYLTRKAVMRGPGVFVATVDAAQQLRPSVTADDVAARPDVLAELTHGTRYGDAFATREGFAFATAMYRAGGWSAVELSRTEPPSATANVVRPDRYLEGAPTPSWEWPAEVTADRTKRGFTIDREGRVGAASFVEWLSTHLPAAVARAAYLGFEADRYRYWKNGDAWIWEWVSLWNTPSTAQQVVEVLDAGLRKHENRHFTVLRKGVVVSVVGSTLPLVDDGMKFAPLLVDMRPKLVAGRPLGIHFVPTPADRLQNREMVTGLKPEPWTEPTTNISLDLTPLDDWKLLPTKEAPLPWIAKREADGAVIQMLIELPSVTGTQFEDEAYATEVQKEFGKTMILDAEATVVRRDKPVEGTLRVDATGAIKDWPGAQKVRTVAWQIPVARYLVTFSVQAAPDGFETALADMEKVIASIRAPQASNSAGGGVIKFEVEE